MIQIYIRNFMYHSRKITEFYVGYFSEQKQKNFLSSEQYDVVSYIAYNFKDNELLRPIYNNSLFLKGYAIPTL